MVSSTDLPSLARHNVLQRSLTSESPAMAAARRTDTAASTSSLPSTSLKSKRLHDMLHSHHHNDKQSQGGNVSNKHKRTGSSNDEPNPSSMASTGSPLKAASSLLHGLVSKQSTGYNTRHARSASALERIASRTPGLKNSPLASASSSRRQSIVNIDTTADSAVAKQDQRVHPVDILRERQKNVVRSEEIREVYQSIEERAKSAEGRLEDVFGELQQKVKLLASAIGELQELVRDTTQMQEGFNRESEEVEAEYKSRIDDFDSLEAQSKAIEGCERRIAEGKERVERANEKLEAVRLRVEQWEKREHEWQKRTSKQLKAGWITSLIVVITIVVLLITRKWFLARHRPAVEIDALRHLIDNTALPAIAAQDLREVLTSRLQHTSSTNTASSAVTSSAEDVRLKLLDEL